MCTCVYMYNTKCNVYIPCERQHAIGLAYCIYQFGSCYMTQEAALNQSRLERRPLVDDTLFPLYIIKATCVCRNIYFYIGSR